MGWRSGDFGGVDRSDRFLGGCSALRSARVWVVHVLHATFEDRSQLHYERLVIDVTLDVGVWLEHHEVAPDRTHDPTADNNFLGHHFARDLAILPNHERSAANPSSNPAFDLQVARRDNAALDRQTTANKGLGLLAGGLASRRRRNLWRDFMLVRFDFLFWILEQHLVPPMTRQNAVLPGCNNSVWMVRRLLDSQAVPSLVA